MYIALVVINREVIFVKKAGIVSLYYRNFNHGGLLQAYALVQLMQQFEVDAKQISYEKMPVKQESFVTRIKKYSLKQIVRIVFDKIKQKYINLRDKRIKRECANEIKNRQKRFIDFMESIPHTEVVNHTTIEKLESEFDFFITGSDQVWNPNWADDVYFLNFTNKKKLSYAASIGKDSFNDVEANFFGSRIKDIDIITVREESAKKLVEKYSQKAAQVVLDPTLMLEKKQWEIIEEKVEVPKKYIMCYLLGKNKAIHRKIRKIADEKRLKIVYLPFCHEQECYKEKEFGDIRLANVGPKEFLYLIHNAEYIMTDSFHAVVFSLLYHKRFIVFNRYYAGKKLANGRIVTLLSKVGLIDRYCDKVYEDISDEEIKWDKIDSIIADERKMVIDYLKGKL